MSDQHYIIMYCILYGVIHDTDNDTEEKSDISFFFFTYLFFLLYVEIPGKNRQRQQTKFIYLSN